MKLNHLFIPVSLLLFTASCKKMVDAGQPKVQVSGTNLYANAPGATSALLGIYANLEGYNDISFTLLPGLSADELISYSTPVSMYYTNALNANVNNDFWTKCYKYIYQANDLINQVNASSGISDSVKRQLTGEAKFLRAFCHFYLVNLFGNIPYITGTDYTANNLATRMSAKDTVYPKMIADLKDAQSNTSDSYPTGDRTRINKAVATALLARAYLYSGDWADAETQAGLVIANGNYLLEDSLDNVFLVKSREAIWQFFPNNTSYTNAPEGYNFFIGSAPQLTTAKVSLSDSLYKAFESGDRRQEKWVGTFVLDATHTYHFPYKYKVNLPQMPVSEYTVVMRLAELYLIRAEARAQQNKIADAVADLNIIRKRAGLPAIDPAISQAECLDRIQHERRVELFVEWGHRWLDLKRTGAAGTVMPAVCAAKGGHWDPNWQLYPIPQLQLTTDVNMTGHQNPGY